MEQRKTMLAVDANGHYYVAVRKDGRHTYTDAEIVRLFIEENEKYKGCEVVALDETVDCAGSTASIGE